MLEMQVAGNYGDQGFAGVPGLEGFSPVSAQAKTRTRRVREAARLFADAVNGRNDMDSFMLRQAMRPTSEVHVRCLMEKYPGLYGDPGGRQLGLRETMSVTDYQALYVDVLDRMYYGYYNAYPIVNKSLVKMHSLNDFRVVSRYMNDGMVSPLTAIPPGGGMNQRSLYGPVPQDGATLATATTAPLQYQPKAYQSSTSVNWQALVNDDLGIFKDLANRLAIAGNRGISQYITQQFFDANGPHASLYTTAYHNIINTTNGASINNPPLGSQGLMDAFKILAGMTDAEGQPILLTGKLTCVYGPGDVAIAENLQNALSVQVSVEGGTQAGSTGFPSQFLNVNNWVVRNMAWVMDPYIPLVATTKTKSWILVVDPNTQARPCVEMGFLKGFETPQIFTKVPNTARVGGGVDQMMGDFYTMNQDMKIITVFGSVQLDGRTTVGSNGSST